MTRPADPSGGWGEEATARTKFHGKASQIPE